MLTAYLKAFITDDSGATAIEYGLIAALVCIVVIASMIMVGDAVIDLFDSGAAETLEAQTAKIR